MTDADRIKKAASAGVALLNRDTTLVPGSMRHTLAFLEAVLLGLAEGRLLVVAPEAKVESEQTVQPDQAEEESCST